MENQMCVHVHSLYEWLTISLFIVIVAALGYLLYRVCRKLLQFDSLFQLLAHDINVNLEHFEKISKSAIMSDVSEVKDAHRNMMIMKGRLEEYVVRMGEIANRKLTRRFVHKNPPVVV